MTFIVAGPVQVYENEENVRDYIVSRNFSILKEAYFPASPFVTIKDLIGDPMCLTDECCDKLTECGVLTRAHATHNDGSLMWTKIGDDKIPVFEYVWASGDVQSAPEETLRLLAWELRHHPRFFHVTET
jgi:hypothetical protein